MERVFKLSLPLIAALTMTACGSSSSSSNDDAEAAPGNGQAEAGFTDNAQWVFRPQRGDVVCFDFDTSSDVDCSGTEWDIRMEMGMRNPEFYTNSGESGEGNGGTLGSPFEYSWTELQAFSSGMVDNNGDALSGMAYLTDTVENAFTNADNMIGSAVFEYTETHQLLSNYGVILVTTDNSSAFDSTSNAVYAVQITGYYGGATGSESGHPSLRWVNVGDYSNDPANTVINETELDASEGWVYFDLASGLAVADPQNDGWQLAFNRYNVKTNSGVSGTGSVGSFFALQPEGFYDGEGNAITSAFSDSNVIASAENALTDINNWSAVSSWTADSAFSNLNPETRMTMQQGSPMPQYVEYGFFTYDFAGELPGNVGGTQHTLIADSGNGVMLRSGSSDSFARMHLTSIVYDDPSDYNSQTTWTFDFDVQPAVQ